MEESQKLIINKPTTNQEDQSSATLIDMDEPIFQRWFMDTCASVHVCSDLMMFETFEQSTQSKIVLGNRSKCRLVGKGTVRLELFGSKVMTLSDVVYMPSVTLNVISLGTLESQGHEIFIKGEKIRVMKGYEQVMIGTREYNNAYCLDFSRTFMRKDDAIYKKFEELWENDEENQDENIVNGFMSKFGWLLKRVATTKLITDNQSLKTEACSDGPVFQPWLMDSGASVHVCSNLMMFDTFEQSIQGFIVLSDGSKCEVVGKGTVKLELGGKIRTLSDVVYIPGVSHNLISLGTLASQGYEIYIKSGKIRVMKGFEQFMLGMRARSNVYYLVSRTFMRKDESIFNKLRMYWTLMTKKIWTRISIVGRLFQRQSQVDNIW